MTCKQSPCSPTELIKVCINAIWSSHRADKTSFQEGAPSIHQHSLSSLVILRDEGRHRMWVQCCWQALAGLCPEIFLQHLNSHRTDSPNTSIYSLVHSLSIHLSLSEEEVNFIVITVIVVRNNCWTHKLRFCRKKNLWQKAWNETKLKQVVEVAVVISSGGRNITYTKYSTNTILWKYSVTSKSMQV